MKAFDILIIGGGAAGYFTALNIAENNKNLRIAILEKGKETLSKVRISGGGRCNVTHHCFEVSQLVKYYPRGERELRGPFTQFSPKDTIDWLAKQGVKLKVEDDGRMFPITDSSQTIIDCFQNLADKYRVQILTQQTIQQIKVEENTWILYSQNEKYTCDHLIITTGSSTKIWDQLAALGHKIISPVPSLFTFNIKDKKLNDLMGLSTLASVKINQSKLKESGPLLITHWGLSGPAVLKLSAWGARELAEKNYQFTITVNWLENLDFEHCMTRLKQIKDQQAKKLVKNRKPFEIPTRLWEYLLDKAEIPEQINWADLSKKQLNALANWFTQAEYPVNGKSTFKEEFVTAGGVDLKEVNFKTMQSKLYPNLYFAGEVLNIDAITGGFNFQNAWSTSYLVAQNFQ